MIFSYHPTNTIPWPVTEGLEKHWVSVFYSFLIKSFRIENIWLRINMRITLKRKNGKPYYLILWYTDFSIIESIARE